MPGERMSPDKRKAPGGESEGPEVRWLATDDSLPRCTDCGREIFAPASIASGCGRDCRRKLQAVA